MCSWPRVCSSRSPLRSSACLARETEKRFVAVSLRNSIHGRRTSHLTVRQSVFLLFTASPRAHPSAGSPFTQHSCRHTDALKPKPIWFGVFPAHHGAICHVVPSTLQCTDYPIARGTRPHSANARNHGGSGISKLISKWRSRGFWSSGPSHVGVGGRCAELCSGL